MWSPTEAARDVEAFALGVGGVRKVTTWRKVLSRAVKVAVIVCQPEDLAYVGQKLLKEFRAELREGRESETFEIVVELPAQSIKLDAEMATWSDLADSLGLKARP